MTFNTIEKVVIIIPTYNESLVIDETINKLMEYIHKINNFDIEILIFDSASTDKTEEAVRGLQTEHEGIHFVSEHEKTGLGSAYHQAMEHALNHLNANIIFEYDADGSHQPCYIKPMLDAMKNADVVVGSRYVKGGSIPSNWGFKRKLLSRLGNLVSRIVLHPKYKDYTSDFRATRASVLKRAWPAKFLTNGYAYKLHLFWLLHLEKARIIEYPIEFIDREKGISKLPANSIKDSLNVIFCLRFYQVRTYLKMCSVGAIGAVLQFATYNLGRLVLSTFFSMIIAVSAAIILNFILNSQFTFKKSLNTRSFKRIIVFISFSLLMILLQSLLVKSSVNYLGSGFLLENMSILLVLIIGSFINYSFYSKIVWKNNKNELCTDANI